MRIEILTIGDELLDGRVIDTNTVRLASALAAVGLQVAQRTSITDDIDIIVTTAQAVASRQTELCVVSGGLGPTTDDLTVAAFAQLLGVEVIRDPAQMAKITQMLQQRQRPVTANQLKQAELPAGAQAIVNPVGAALGFVVHYQGCRFVAAPGIPQEFDAMVEQAVIHPLRRLQVPLPRRAWYCFGLPEAAIDDRLATIRQQWPRVRLQYRVKFPEVHVTMHSSHADQLELDEAAAFATAALHEHVFATTDISFAAGIVALLRQQQLSVATAESCTGGLMSDMLTDVPGSSAVFPLGMVCYSNTAKQEQLGVPAVMLQTAGAVSAAVVEAMATAVRQRGQASYGLAISGIAGPDGATADKPVGTIWLALAGPDQVQSQRLNLGFDRRQNKIVSSYACLDMLRRQLQRQQPLQ